MTTIVAPICLGCTHFRPDEDGLTCDAFPGGIPEEIITSQVDHRDPVDGDGGVVFEAKNEEAAAYAEDLFSGHIPE